MFPVREPKIIAYTVGTYDDPRLVCASHNPTAFLGAFEQGDLEPGERCAECGIMLGADPALDDQVEENRHGARVGGHGAIIFGDGAHRAMIGMLQVAAEGHWLVSVLQEGQEADGIDAALVMVDAVDAEGLRGWLVDADGRPSDEATQFDWVSYPTVVVH
jgi:hypothetical protein